MSVFVFNRALGKVRYYAELPAANDALVLVLLKSGGLESDATLRHHATLATLLAGSSDEADFTDYQRKTVAAVSVTVDDTNDRLLLDMDDVVWPLAGGATNNALAKLLVCYQPAVAVADDSLIVPLAAYDFVATTDGTDLTWQVADSGFYRAASG